MSYKIPLDSPLLCGNELDYLTRCIKANWLSHQGQFVQILKEELKSYIGVNHCIPVSSGTNAIFIALQALGIKPGDEVIVPSLTMSGCITPIMLLGATPVWIDCAVDSVNLDIDQIENLITKKTKAILAVDLYGTALDIARLKQKVNGIPIIEDMAESIGAIVNNKKAGNDCDIAIHSFHNKIIAAGEGGALTFNNNSLQEKIENFVTPSPNNVGSNELILNSRISNLSAAVAVAQLENIEYLIDQRRKIAQFYNENIDQKYHKIKEGLGQRWVYWRYQIYTPHRDKVCDYLNSKNIEARPIFYPMHKHPKFKFKGKLPNCEKLSETGLDIPISPKMTLNDARLIVDTLNSI